MNKTDIDQMIADSRTALLNSQYQSALKLALMAVQGDESSAEAHNSAAVALMSLNRQEEAVDAFRVAASLDPANGDRYFDLAFAQASARKTADALRNIALAEELGCRPETYARLYNLLGVICYDAGRYEDALINLEKAERLIGVDMDILLRKAVIYGILDDPTNGLITANVMKLIAPSVYSGYQIAFKFLVQAGRLEEAALELERSRKYIKPQTDYYEDLLSLQLELFTADGDNAHLSSALSAIDEGMRNAKTDLRVFLEGCINAAEVFLRLEDPDSALRCLDAASHPKCALGRSFRVLTPADAGFSSPGQGSAEAAAALPGQEEEREDSSGSDGFKPVPDPAAVPAAEPVSLPPLGLDSQEREALNPDIVDHIDRLLLGVFSMKKDFTKVAAMAARMKESSNQYNSYLARYSEVNALKELGSPQLEAVYRQAVRFFRNAAILNPGDMLALTFRIQCCTDFGDFAEAEELCNLLSSDTRKTFIEKISAARAARR